MELLKKHLPLVLVAVGAVLMTGTIYVMGGLLNTLLFLSFASMVTGGLWGAVWYGNNQHL